MPLTSSQSSVHRNRPTLPLRLPSRTPEIAQFQRQGSAGVDLGSHGPGKLPEKRKSPKVVRGGCKRSFGPREQKSPKSLLHHSNPLLQRCKIGLHQCKRHFACWVQKTFCQGSMRLCNLRVRRKISNELGFRAAISEPKTRSSCGNSGDFGSGGAKALRVLSATLILSKNSRVWTRNLG